MLIGLSLWERSTHNVDKQPEREAPTVADATIRAIGGASRPVAESSVIEALAPREGHEPAIKSVEIEAMESSPAAVNRAMPSPVEPARLPRIAGETSVREKPLPVPAEAVPPGERPSPGRSFALQLGVFTSAANAESLRAKLTLAGIVVQVESRVQVGPFSTREEALAAQARLQTLGFERGRLMLVKP